MPVLAVALGGALALAAGCRESPTSPLYETSAPAPSGLGVAAGYTVSARDTLAGVPSVTADGDSLVVVARLASDPCPLDLSASAGRVGGEVVVTNVLTFASPGRVCLQALSAYGPVVRTVVRPAPPGRYTVVLRERSQRQTGTAAYYERVVVRRAITLR